MANRRQCENSFLPSALPPLRNTRIHSSLTETPTRLLCCPDKRLAIELSQSHCRIIIKVFAYLFLLYHVLCISSAHYYLPTEPSSSSRGGDCYEGSDPAIDVVSCPQFPPLPSLFHRLLVLLWAEWMTVDKYLCGSPDIILLRDQIQILRYLPTSSSSASLNTKSCGGGKNALWSTGTMFALRAFISKGLLRLPCCFPIQSVSSTVIVIGLEKEKIFPKAEKKKKGKEKRLDYNTSYCVILLHWLRLLSQCEWVGDYTNGR